MPLNYKEICTWLSVFFILETAYMTGRKRSWKQ